MATAQTFTKSGNKATTAVKLDSDVFGVEVKSHGLLKNAYVAYLANGRVGNASTKTRGLVRGGGRKPWRQKGTGRARFGSSRNPIWRGGGIAFGPTGEQNHAQKISTKANRQAIRQALSLAAKDGDLRVVESLSALEAKTKDMTQLLDKINASGNILCVVVQKDETKQRAAQNLSGVSVVAATYLNVYDLLNADNVVIEQKALSAISDWLGDKA